MPKIEHLLVNDDEMLSEFCLSRIKLCPLRFEFLLKIGALYLNKKRIISNVLLKKKDYLRIHHQPKLFPLIKVNPPKWIYEDHDFLIAYKESGYPTHASLDNSQQNLISYFEKQRNEKLFITHRLDNESSGLILIARNKNFQRHFNFLLENHQVEKKYRAWVVQAPPLGLHVHSMLVSPQTPKVILENPLTLERTQICKLEILEIQEQGPYWELLIHLITGRTHQIRSQLSFLGSPLLGDIMYGGIPWEKDKIALECTSLKFPPHFSFEC